MGKRSRINLGAGTCVFCCEKYRADTKEGGDMKKSTLVVLTFIFVLFAPVAISAGASMHLASLSAQKSSLQERTRAYLNKEVRHELVMLPYYSVFDWLQFSVKPDSTVVLMGQVTRPTLKSDAEN